MTEKQIEKWVQLAVENEDITNYNITINGTTNKDDGYTGNIYFVTVNGKTRDGHRQSLDLVIKSSKESIVLRQQTPIKETFDKEIDVYTRILRVFQSLQKEKGTENYLDFMPRCYATQTTDVNEVLAFENLKVQGFDVCDRMVPLTYDHIKLVLQAYGKWHAFSLALKRQKKEIFDTLVEGNINMFTYFCSKVGLVDLFLELFEQSRDACIAPSETDILNKLQISKNDADYIFSDLFFEDADDSVILHGDCWSGNFMFKSAEHSSKPIDVRIVDWQCSGLGSPVMDLSHLIYGCCDTGYHKDVKNLLEIYYQSLSDCLKYLGCDSEEVFPYSKLVDHWKKFSRYGLFLHGFVIKFSICETEDAPDFADTADQGKGFLENFNFPVSNPTEFHRRIKNNLLHYVASLS